MRLGEKIEKLRAGKGLTKVEMAKRLGLKDSSAISQWAAGKSNPSMENRARIAKEFGVPLSYLNDDKISHSEMLAQKHNIFYDNITARLPEGVRDGASSYEAVEFRGAKHIGIKDTVYGNFFELSLYSSEGYLPIMLESFDDKHPYAFKIGDKEVYSGAEPGDYAVIRPLDKAGEGKTALVKIGGKYCIRKISYSKDEIILRDGRKQTRMPRARAEIVGQVIAFLKLP